MSSFAPPTQLSKHNKNSRTKNEKYAKKEK